MKRKKPKLIRFVCMACKAYLTEDEVKRDAKGENLCDACRKKAAHEKGEGSP